ncbi:PucR family transcriptional regulator [Nocardioides maradonensis]
MSGPKEPVLAELAEWAEGQLLALVDQACGLVRERIPLYANGELVPATELARSVTQNMRFMIAALADPDGTPDLEVPRETGRRRAHQGAPLPEVLQAYRISFATLWDALVARSRTLEPGSSELALLDAASRVWQLTDQHAVAVTEAYRMTTAELMLRQQRRRGALVEAVLTGQTSSDAGPWDAAALLGLPPDGELVVVAAETGRLAEEALPGIERELAAANIASAWRLTPALQLGIVAVRPDQSDELLEILGAVARNRVGVSPLYRPISGSPRALQLARAALTMRPSGSPGVTMFGDSPLAALMAQAPGEGDRLAEEVLGSVLTLPDDDRDALLETLAAYLEAAGSADVAATVLHCHPNTVRYRLRRIQELTGRSTSDAFALAELAAASYAVNMARGRRTHPHNRL